MGIPLHPKRKEGEKLLILSRYLYKLYLHTYMPSRPK